MRYLLFWVNVFVLIPSIVWGMVKIGISPVNITGDIRSLGLKEPVEKILFQNLSDIYIRPVLLSEENSLNKVDVDYLLKTFLYIKGKEITLHFKLVDLKNLKDIYKITEETDSEKILKDVKKVCQEIKGKLLELNGYYSMQFKKSDSFWSKINIFSKISNFISNLFQKKREFDIKVPVPPPPPPPDIQIKTYSNLESQNQTSSYNRAPWQWF